MKVSPCNGFLKEIWFAEASEFPPPLQGAEDVDAASNLTAFGLTPALGDLEFFHLAPATPDLVGGGALGFALILGCGGFAESSGLGIAFCFGFRLFLGWEG